MISQMRGGTSLLQVGKPACRGTGRRKASLLASLSFPGRPRFVLAAKNQWGFCTPTIRRTSLPFPIVGLNLRKAFSRSIDRGKRETNGEEGSFKNQLRFTGDFNLEIQSYPLHHGAKVAQKLPLNGPNVEERRGFGIVFDFARDALSVLISL